jgi:hypothetical protein
MKMERVEQEVAEEAFDDLILARRQAPAISHAGSLASKG